MGPFALFALILIGIYWLSRAVGLFDQLIGDGQSLGVFLQFMILFLPQVVAIVLPIVAFAAAVYVSNRLHSDSEMVIFQFGGLSPFRLMRPFAIYGMMVFALSSALWHYLVPASILQLQDLSTKMASDLAARLIVEGRFIHPSDEVTFFVRKIEADGSLSDIFLHDQRSETQDITYTAHKAAIFTVEGETRLVMFDGLIQTFDRDRELLAKIQFDDFVFDVATLASDTREAGKSTNDYSTLTLLFPTPEMERLTGASATDLKMQAHVRIELPLQSLFFPMLAMAVMMVGAFSRFGVMKQILAAVGIALALTVMSAPLRDIARGDISLWPLIYLHHVLAVILTLTLLNRGPGRRRWWRVRA